MEGVKEQTCLTEKTLSKEQSCGKLVGRSKGLHTTEGIMGGSTE